MPLWKGKKSDKKLPKVLLCPKCLQPCLHHNTAVSGLYAPAKFYCSCCGYKGRVYVDISGDDKKEKENLEWLKEEFPEDVLKKKDAAILARECLEKKWVPNQEENECSLREWCPFCADVQINCDICKCPKELCAEQATEGLIGKLNEMYDEDVPLSEVDSEIYEKIVKGFQKLAKTEEKQRSSPEK